MADAKDVPTVVATPAIRCGVCNDYQQMLETSLVERFYPYVRVMYCGNPQCKAHKRLIRVQPTKIDAEYVIDG